MPNALVSGRVDATRKQQVDRYLQRAGLTSSDVIRIVWDNIALTGTIPQAIPRDAGDNALMARLEHLRSATPRSEHLEQLTPEQLKVELERRG